MQIGLGMGVGSRPSSLSLQQQAFGTMRRLGATVIGLPDNVLGDGAPNLLSAPEDFDSATWTKDGTAVTANAATAPDGTATADRLVPSASSVLHRVLQNGVPVAGSTGAQSIRVKADGYNKIALREAHASGNYAAFDLSGGTLIESTAAGQSITALGGGWFSCSMTVTGAATQALSLHVLPASYTTGAPTFAWSGDGTSGIYIWGAKLELGSTATAYTPQSVLRQRGSFVDSAGTTPVTAVGDLVGRVNDRIGSNHATQATTASKPLVSRVPKKLGPNLVVNGTFDSGTAGWTGVTYPATLSASGGELSVVRQGANGRAVTQIAGTVGKSYQISGLIKKTAGTTNADLAYAQNDFGGTITIVGSTANSTLTYSSSVMTAAVPVFTVVVGGNGGVAGDSFGADNIEVREVLEWTNAISFDGSNDFLQLSQPVFTAANDDGFVCAGVVPTTITGIQAVVASRGPSGTPTSCANGLFMSSGAPVAYWEGGVSTTLTGAVAAPGVPVVISAHKVGTSVSLRVNGAVAQSGTTSVTNSTIANTSIGISLSGTANAPALPGNEKITVAVMCKGVVSAADALLIEKWIGSLQGQTL